VIFYLDEITGPCKNFNIVIYIKPDAQFSQIQPGNIDNSTNDLLSSCVLLPVEDVGIAWLTDLHLLGDFLSLAKEKKKTMC
jgi:hypothetical protein